MSHAGVFYIYENFLKSFSPYPNMGIQPYGNYRGLEKGYYRIAVRTHEDNVRLLKAMRLILKEER